MDDRENIEFNAGLVARNIEFILESDVAAQVSISDALGTAILALLQNLLDDWGQLPPELIPIAVEINNQLGYQVYHQTHPNDDT